MKKLQACWKFIVLYVICGGAVFGVLFYLFKNNDFFQTLFYEHIPTPGSASGAADPQQLIRDVKALTESAALLSFGILVFILLLQVFAFLTALIVFRGIKKSTESLSIRLKKLENADLFLDLPLYFGLLGTVSSFVIMSFNPQISRLIAYSSTLVGIIFSVILRLVLQYPLRQKLTVALAASAEEQQTAQKGVKR